MELSETRPDVADTPSPALAPVPDIRPIERLYRDHYHGLCQRLRKVFGHGPPEPEDLAQTAFAKLIDAPALTSLADPAAFLFRMAINSGRDRIRHSVRARILIDEQLALDGQEQVDQLTPANIYETQERLSVTQRAMATLTPKQREILVRSRIKAETFEQIRAATGWSKADISRNLQAALGVLQRAMDDYGNGATPGGDAHG